MTSSLSFALPLVGARVARGEIPRTPVSRASMQDAEDQALVKRALDREQAAVRELVNLLTPVVQVRVARALVRSERRRGRDPRQEVADLTQDVLASLFADGARALRAWEPTKGLSLKGFAGILAERRCASILRTARRNPWTEDPTLDAGVELPDSPLEDRVESRQTLSRLLQKMNEVLSPLGCSLFRQLLVEQRPAAEVSQRTQMSLEAIYAWRSRLAKLLKSLRAEIEDETAGGKP